MQINIEAIICIAKSVDKSESGQDQRSAFTAWLIGAVEGKSGLGNAKRLAYALDMSFLYENATDTIRKTEI